MFPPVHFKKCLFSHFRSSPLPEVSPLASGPPFNLGGLSQDYHVALLIFTILLHEFHLQIHLGWPHGP